MNTISHADNPLLPPKVSTPPPPVSTPPPPPTPPVVSSSISASKASDAYYEPLAESHDEWIDSIRSTLQHLPAWKQSCEAKTDKWNWVVYNRGVSSILQKRQQPVCGILALGMASEMMCLPWQDIWDVVAVAKEQGYTRYGEMFSARWLLDLATSKYGMAGYILEGNLLTKIDILTKHLAKGHPVLMAYDTDANFEPCCRKGHKAHWAILTGFMFKVREDKLTQTHLDQIQQDNVTPNLYHIPKTLLDAEDFVIPSNTDDIFVIAKQGKSKRYGVWAYKALCESNANLEELSPAREADERNYVVPKKGMKSGLANQAILLKPS